MVTKGYQGIVDIHIAHEGGIIVRNEISENRRTLSETGHEALRVVLRLFRPPSIFQYLWRCKKRDGL